jgi:hypothetical protein
MTNELGVPARRRGGWVVVAVAALALAAMSLAAMSLAATPLAAQGRLARTAAPQIVRVTPSKAGAAVHDSTIAAPRSDSIVVADSTEAGADDDARDVSSGIVVVDRFGHEVRETQEQPAGQKRPDEAPDYAKTGSVARARVPAAMTPPPSRAPSSP